MPASRYAWSRLNCLQLGRYAEYPVKMEFIMLGYDVYGVEVDDRGIDLVVRTDVGGYYDVQVKSVRGLNYIFFPKDKFCLRPNLRRSSCSPKVLLRSSTSYPLWPGRTWTPCW
ncbi:MAG: hypothetical protein ACUVX9_09345 [Anaerolineae bacterium]